MHLIVAYASSSKKHSANIKILHSLMESIGRKVKRYGLTKNSEEIDFGNNLAHPKLDKKTDMKIGIGKFSCIKDPIDKTTQPYCIEHSKNKYSLCLYGKTPNLKEIAKWLEKTKHSVFYGNNSRAEIFLHFFITSDKKTIEEKFIDTLNSISGQYCIAFSVNDQYLFIGRRGKADPFYISKTKKSNEFICSSNIHSLNEKNIIQVIAPWVVIKFTAGKEQYEKIKLK